MPVNRAVNARARSERDISELLGLAKGVLADGVVNVREAEYLRDWAGNHPDAIVKWPVSIIYSRLQTIFSDGRVDDEERQDLQELLGLLVGGPESVALHYDAPTPLPLDDPWPLICWHDELYVFTGKFAYGTRAHCTMEVTSRGGTVEDNVTRRTTFLVVGTFSSADWVTTSYGRKIQKAAELRDSGFPIRIVSEDHWAAALGATV